MENTPGFFSRVLRSFKNFIYGLVFLVILAVFGLFIYFWWSPVEEGKYVGHVESVVERGWFCKTWEGTFLTKPDGKGIRERVYFSINDEGVFNMIEKLNGQEAAFKYQRRIFIPFCLGETGLYLEPVDVPEDSSKKASGALSEQASALKQSLEAKTEKAKDFVKNIIKDTDSGKSDELTSKENTIEAEPVVSEGEENTEPSSQDKPEAAIQEDDLNDYIQENSEQ